MVNIERINYLSPRYPLETDLRNRILLRPIGIPDHAWEMHDEKAWHFVAIESDTVIGCVVLNPLNPEKTKTQLMQMAVETAQQGKGIGKLLVQELLSFCETTGIKEVVCHARENAVPFYLKLGFEIYDEPFMEVGMSHYHMKIRLVDENY
ncbi:Acetyltransferase (GNAT) domain-containing protein [Flavobacterium fryxellicola]|uniref:GNAT family acetyltransferase n=1 Tax=Flavobacterium fryxellicola TaxID=249352 RepID=A0A167XYJ0_9FLAO|nr:GNAT family N-acetyltransferase [Flavobacterium fryxellicola]OAB28828.1 GNAT family acetyltransferase [Flavobacterium fryxellicola]SHN61291.1 Acetyltransferase (GNAT) domain-containing protein [Flavobacterium fryxellicola]